MTRYDPEWEGGTMDPHPEGDYVRYKVAQALYEGLLGLVESLHDPDDPEYEALLLKSYGVARAALALAEKKDT